MRRDGGFSTPAVVANRNSRPKKSPLRRDARGGKVSVGLTEALSARGRHDDYDDGDEADKRDEGEAAGELHEISKSGKVDLFSVNAGSGRELGRKLGNAEIEKS